MGKEVKINNIKAQWDPKSSRCWEQSGEWEGNLKGRNVRIRERLKKGGKDIWKMGNSMCKWLQSREADSKWFCSSFALCEELDLSEMSVKCQSDIYVSSALWLSEELLSCSNASLDCFPLAVKVRRHKVLNHVTDKFGTLLSLTPSSSFTFWKIYSHMCPKLHSSK